MWGESCDFKEEVTKKKRLYSLPAIPSKDRCKGTMFRSICYSKQKFVKYFLKQKTCVVCSQLNAMEQTTKTAKY